MTGTISDQALLPLFDWHFPLTCENAGPNATVLQEAGSRQLLRLDR